MAVVDTHSAELQNIEADPVVANSVLHTHGRLRIKSATVAIAAGDDDGTTLRFFRVKSSDSIKSLQLMHDTVTGSSDWDCGLYTIDSGAVVDSNLYAEAFTIAVAVPEIPHALVSSPYLELRFGVAASNINEINNQVFEDLGLSTDPQLEYDVVLLSTTVGSAAGDVTLTMLYTAGD